MCHFVEDLRDINDRMTGHLKCQLGLPLWYAIDSDHHQAAGIEDGIERGQPRLIVVL